jgi:hypothetical protein
MHKGNEMRSKSLIGIAVASTFGWAAVAHAGPGHHHSGWVAAGEEQYPPIVMSEGQASQDSLAMNSTSTPASVEDRSSVSSKIGNAVSNVGSTFAKAGGVVSGFVSGDGSHTNSHGIRTKSSSGTPWVASGEEIYPPMAMSGGSRPAEFADSSRHFEQSIGSTSGSASGTLSGSLPSDAAASKFDSAGNEVSALDSGSEGIYSEYYLVTWSPMTATAWDSYMMPFQPANGDLVVLMDDAAYILTAYDVILLPTDSMESNASSRMSSEEPAA